MALIFLAAVAVLLVFLYSKWKNPTAVPSEKAERYKVVIIGSGFSGVCAAIKLDESGIHNYTILEKRSLMAGTWYENTYPGAACDIASQMYSYSFHPNPGWSRAYSGGAEIQEYLKAVAEHYGVNRKMIFNQNVVRCQWDENRKIWRIFTENGSIYEANFIFGCTGPLHYPSIPNFEGKTDFKKPQFHTAEWDHSVDLTGKKVGIIGTGASAVQVVPSIVDRVAELYVFQRTPAWVPDRYNYDLPKWLVKSYENFPFLMKVERFFRFWSAEFIYHINFRNNETWLGRTAKGLVAKMMKKHIKDPELQRKLIPSYPLGCKRITPSDHYLEAFNRPHVHLITEGIEKFTSEGIKLSNEVVVELDVVVYATGFDVMTSARNPTTYIGRDGKNFAEEAGDTPTAYQGTAYPGFPNLFTILGPNSGLGHSSIIYVIECMTNYAVGCLRKVIREELKAIEVKEKAARNYNDMIYKSLETKVWTTGCFSWYKNAEGKNFVIWPKDLVSFWWMTLFHKFDDFIFE